MTRKPIHSQQILKSRRQELRNNATQEEKILWEKLRKSQLGFKFQRQHSIGPYIADFYCASKKLVIELDGNQHLDTQEYDVERTTYFNHLEIKVLRFWNEDIVKSLEKVIIRIRGYLK